MQTPFCSFLAHNITKRRCGSCKDSFKVSMRIKVTGFCGIPRRPLVWALNVCDYVCPFTGLDKREAQGRAHLPALQPNVEERERGQLRARLAADGQLLVLLCPVFHFVEIPAQVRYTLPLKFFAFLETFPNTVDITSAYFCPTTGTFRTTPTTASRRCARTSCSSLQELRLNLPGRTRRLCWSGGRTGRGPTWLWRRCSPTVSRQLVVLRWDQPSLLGSQTTDYRYA